MKTQFFLVSFNFILGFASISAADRHYFKSPPRDSEFKEICSAAIDGIRNHPVTIGAAGAGFLRGYLGIKEAIREADEVVKSLTRKLERAKRNREYSKHYLTVLDKAEERLKKLALSDFSQTDYWVIRGSLVANGADFAAIEKLDEYWKRRQTFETSLKKLDKNVAKLRAQVSTVDTSVDLLTETQTKLSRDWAKGDAAKRKLREMKMTIQEVNMFAQMGQVDANVKFLNDSENLIERERLATQGKLGRSSSRTAELASELDQAPVRLARGFAKNGIAFSAYTILGIAIDMAAASNSNPEKIGSNSPGSMSNVLDPSKSKISICDYFEDGHRGEFQRVEMYLNALPEQRASGSGSTVK